MVEHPMWVVRRQLVYTEIRYLRKTAKLGNLFNLSNLWLVGGKLITIQG